MPIVERTRCYRFPAAHVLRRDDLPDAENERIYGKCARYHGHDYGVEVTVAGAPDPRTGWVVDPAALDAVVHERIVARLGRRALNDDPWFRERVPTAEHVVETIGAELGRALRERLGARLVRVRLLETRRNHFEWGEAG